MLRGCITALVTPMFADGSIDYDSLGSLIEWQIANGVSGVVANGSTGEAANLATKETIDLIEFIIKKVAGRVKVVVGAGTASTMTSVKFIERVNEIKGVDYLMCLAPYYVKPTQNGLYIHFSQCVESSKFPVILYNVPGRTGCDVHNDTVLRLAKDLSNVVGLKDATGDLERCIDMVKRMPKDFIYLSGDDCTVLQFLLLGGSGVISVVSNIRPAQMSKLCQLVDESNLADARKLNNEMLELYSSMFCEANPIPVKWALFHEKRIATPELRLPLTILSEQYHSKISNILKGIG